MSRNPYKDVERMFNRLHSNLSAALAMDRAREQASIAAEYDDAPSTWCRHGPPITPQDTADEQYYTAMARDAAASAASGAEGGYVCGHWVKGA